MYWLKTVIVLKRLLKRGLQCKHQLAEAIILSALFWRCRMSPKDHSICHMAVERCMVGPRCLASGQQCLGARASFLERWPWQFSADLIPVKPRVEPKTQQLKKLQKARIELLCLRNMMMTCLCIIQLELIKPKPEFCGVEIVISLQQYLLSFCSLVYDCYHQRELSSYRLSD